MGGSEDGRLLDFGAVFDLKQSQLCVSECLDVCGSHGGVPELEQRDASRPRKNLYGGRREEKFGQSHKNASIDSRRLIVILVLHCDDVHCSVGLLGYWVIVHKSEYSRHELGFTCSCLHGHVTSFIDCRQP